MFGIPKDRCIAAGDSGNDILMLAGTPSCLHCFAICSFKITGALVSRHKAIYMKEVCINLHAINSILRGKLSRHAFRRELTLTDVGL